MKNTTPLNKVILYSILLFTVGCVSTQSIVTGTRRAPVDPAEVRLYSKEPDGAEEIALLNVGAGGTGQYGMNLALAELKKKAGGLGANGVVIVSNKIETHARGSMGTFLPAQGIWISDTSTQSETHVQAKAVYVKIQN